MILKYAVIMQFNHFLQDYDGILSSDCPYINIFGNISLRIIYTRPGMLIKYSLILIRKKIHTGIFHV